MLISNIVLALSVSMDSLGIGITYGIRNTKICRTSKVILFVISILITTLSIRLGAFLNEFFSATFTKWIGACFLILMGLWIIYQALSPKNEKTFVETPSPTVYQFMIRFLGITVQIIRDPIFSDLDHSKKIDWKEAIYLGVCLSIDSVCIGICSSMIGYHSFLFPILVATFQLFFLSIGRLLGEKIASISRIPENIWNVLSGVLLICIGVSRFLI
ncbi:MAG: sporulation membrane protein YtaF [Clostridia bacterium]|nr:sporulation membrane protein YtaF [Clostridia bacterium]